jgi:Mg-chelatase subunit ChlD
MLHAKIARSTTHPTERYALCITAPDEVVATATSSSSRLAQDIVFVIDKSGSMCSDATPGLDEGERDGITILDLIGHCIKVAVECLGHDDRVALVCFDEAARLSFPATSMTDDVAMANMTDDNKRLLLSTLDNVKPSGGTQIWSGVKKGLETLRRADPVDGRRNRSILVFTDGLDVSKPLRGNLHELNGLLGANAAWSHTVTMNTVGFGHALDSRELFEMAERLNGTFSHIPESSTAGTILINRSATDLSTYGSNLRVTITTRDGVSSTSNLGAIRIGQTRTHPIAHPSLDDIQTMYVSVFDGAEHVVTPVDLSAVVDDAPTVLACWTKADLVATLQGVVDAVQTSAPTVALPYGTEQLAQFRTRHASNGAVHPYIQGCLDDAGDQLRKAVEKEKWCSAWGLHYLRSYLHATRHEIVNNFRDNAIQHFASSAFGVMQQHCERTFLATPPIPRRAPEPRAAFATRTTRTSPPSTLNATANHAVQPVGMSTADYNERYYSGGCFHPDAPIVMSDGRVLPVGQVRKGDQVSCGDGRVASIRCVVWSLGRFEMVTIDGFTLTATHPVRTSHPDEGGWMHPRDLTTNRSEHHRVVNLLLDQHHEIVGARGDDLSSTLRCCTLAHGFRDPVVEHHYLGTDDVVRDLEKIPGFYDGEVHVSFTRNDEHISGIVDGPHPDDWNSDGRNR